MRSGDTVESIIISCSISVEKTKYQGQKLSAPVIPYLNLPSLSVSVPGNTPSKFNYPCLSAHPPLPLMGAPAIPVILQSPPLCNLYGLTIQKVCTS